MMLVNVKESAFFGVIAVLIAPLFKQNASIYFLGGIFAGTVVLVLLVQYLCSEK